MTLSDLHDAALQAWRGEAMRDAIVVHIDAHHDADAREWDFVTISNFIWWAIRDGVAREVFWVVPDPSWETATDRALIVEAVTAIARQHDDSFPVDVEARRVRGVVGGKPFTACALSELPAIPAALLDIDVDYLLVPSIARELPPPTGAMPWMWPADLIAALRARGVDPTMVTVATSVRGGFTPLEWKYLGEELCARIAGAGASGFDEMRLGAQAEHRQDFSSAEVHYGRAAALLPSSGGAWYRLARLHVRCGRDEQARSAFAEVVTRDPSYRAIDSAGRAWHAAGDLAAAAAGYNDVLRMDPESAYAELGLAQLAAARGDHREAVDRFKRALGRCRTLVDAHRGLARSLDRLGEVEDAMAHYDRSIHLELAGHDPIDAPIATCARAPRIFDAGHWEAHRRLAWLQHRMRLPGAAASARMALFGDPRQMDLYWLLALEHLRRGAWRRAGGELMEARRQFRHVRRSWP